MTDAQVAEFLCREVLGWKWVDTVIPRTDPGWGWWLDPRTDQRHAPPDFLSWDGFGLLWKALMRDKRSPAIAGESWDDFGLDGGVTAIAGTASAKDPDPCRALMLAAARAYGMEGV